MSKPRYKTLVLVYPNGAEWEIPVHDIADHRAKYYAAKDPDTTYEREYDFVMHDSYEASDWFFNNMNWSDVKHVAKELVKPTFDPSDTSELEDSYLEKE